MDGKKITIIIATFKERTEKYNSIFYLLESIRVLPINNRLRIIVLNTSSYRDVEFTITLNSIIAPYKRYFEIMQITEQHLKGLQSFLLKENLGELANHINMRSEPCWRNVGLIFASLFNSEVSIFIDDDIVIMDRTFFAKVEENIKRWFHADTVGGISGYYTTDNSYIFKDKAWSGWWKIAWNKEKGINKAIAVLGNGGRWSQSPFIFGGLLILSKTLFTTLAFDPWDIRGSELDYLRSAQKRGFDILLDSQLPVVHNRPDRFSEPYWEKMRKDIFRFIYERRKIKDVGLSAKGWSPYPGGFLNWLLKPRVVVTSLLLCIEFLRRRRLGDAIEAFKNIKIVIIDAERFSWKHRNDHVEFQKQWRQATSRIAKNASLRAVFEQRLKATSEEKILRVE
jgi:hypothetical protein